MASNYRRSLEQAKELADAAKEARRKAEEDVPQDAALNEEVLKGIAGVKHRLRMLVLWLGLYLIIITAIIVLYAFKIIQNDSALWWVAWSIITIIFWSVAIRGFPSDWGLRNKKGV